MRWPTTVSASLIGLSTAVSLPRLGSGTGAGAGSLKFGPHLQFESFAGEPVKPSTQHFTPNCQDGALFVTPSADSDDKHSVGPRILDTDANMIWMEPKWGQTADLKVQQFAGRNFITFWHGTIEDGVGNGSYAMLDKSYRLVKTIRAAGGHAGDFHEFKLTPKGTALITAYSKLHVDLSDMGMSERGWVYDSLFQEIDVITGKLLFEWRASEHVPLEESMATTEFRGYSAERPYDFFHISSVDMDSYGNYIVAARNLGAVMAIEASTGQTLWQLGGKSNDFEFLDGFKGLGQPYDARMYNANYLTVYDAATQSGRLIELVWASRTARQTKEYAAPREPREPQGRENRHDPSNLKSKMSKFYRNRSVDAHENSDTDTTDDPESRVVTGSMQILPSGNVVIGSGPLVTEFSAAGKVQCQTRLAPNPNRRHTGTSKSRFRHNSKNWNNENDDEDKDKTPHQTRKIGSTYRAFKATRWKGYPQALPDVAIRPKTTSQGHDMVHVSWNGATEVGSWLLESSKGGPGGPYDATVMAKKREFETHIVVPPDSGDIVRLVAFSEDMKILGWSMPGWKGIKTAPLREQPRPPPTRRGFVVSVVAGGAVLGLLFILRRRVVNAMMWLTGIVNGRIKGYKIARA